MKDRASGFGPSVQIMSGPTTLSRDEPTMAEGSVCSTSSTSSPGRAWLAAVGAQTAFIEPGSPWENGDCESFNSKLRDELLNGEIFYSLAEARIIVEAWRRSENTERPHSSLGYSPPAGGHHMGLPRDRDRHHQCPGDSSEVVALSGRSFSHSSETCAVLVVELARGHHANRHALACHFSIAELHGVTFDSASIRGAT